MALAIFSYSILELGPKLQVVPLVNYLTCRYPLIIMIMPVMLKTDINAFTWDMFILAVFILFEVGVFPVLK
jgi:hypothetical protein